MLPGTYMPMVLHSALFYIKHLVLVFTANDEAFVVLNIKIGQNIILDLSHFGDKFL